MQLTPLTDFQKDCLVKAKDHLNKIPRNENNIIRWNLMPSRVAVIVDFWKQSKLSAEAFADALLITKTLLPKFAKGKTSSNEKWPELLALLKPEEAEKNKVKKEKQKSEKVVEDAIFKILLRDQVKEIGLRTETIVAEISLYPSRFVSTILGRLERAGRLIKFKSEDKYTKWKVVDKKTKTTEEIVEINIGDGIVIKSHQPKPIDSVIPEIKVIEEPKIQKIELPGKEYEPAGRMNDLELFFRNLKLEDLEAISETEAIVRIPIDKISHFSFPLVTWSDVLRNVYKISSELAPDFEKYRQTGTFLDLLKALEKAKTRMKLNSYQEVIDRFKLILNSAGV